MKKSSLTLVTMLALSGSVFGQAASSLVAQPSVLSGTQQAVESGIPSNLKLCTFELCQMGEDGKVSIQAVAAGSASAIIAQASVPDAERYLVYYPVGQELNPRERRVLRTRYLVTLEDGANLDEIKTRCGMNSITRVREGSNLAVCEETSAGRVLRQLSDVLSDPDIKSAEPIFAKSRVKRAAPNDPFFAPSITTPEDNYQWYLDNVGINGGAPEVDINAEGVFCPIAGGPLVTGAGVTVSIVDDGVAIDHADLIGNTALGPHLNLFGGDAGDPTTLDITSTHGTSVAGIIGATTNDGQGITGIAPNANLSGIRLLPSINDDAALIDDFEESLALGFSTDIIDVSNNSWGPLDDTLDLDRPDVLAAAALEDGALNGRVVGGEARGVVYVWAGGDGGDIADRSD